MQIPSLTYILSGVFLAYIGHSIYTLVVLFKSPTCTGTPCFNSYLKPQPKMQLLLFTSISRNPIASEVTNVLTLRNFDYNKPLQKNIEFDVPLKVRRNGTMFMHSVFAVDDGKELDWRQLQRDGPTVIQRIPLTEYLVPSAATFNLLGSASDSDSKPKKSVSEKPVTHIKRKVFLSILADPNVSMSQQDIPPEMANLIRVSYKHEFLPILQNDFLRNRLSDFEQVTRNTTKWDLEFNYAPISFGKLRFVLHIEHAMKSLEGMGFSKKDIDEVKSIMSDTNVYLLSATVAIAGLHLLFDFLSFKNDIAFWKRKKNYAGLSVRATLWRTFSQIVVFLYLLDENTSMLVLLPAGIGTIIELWKSKRILKLDISLKGVHFRKAIESTGDQATSESFTRAVDKEAMRYLSYILYPLCLCGAVYSLIYQPHKSWYSWTINSLVNGVYAFGFLFMLPQLFINYKLKSVAALPWRAFMYKAFNTFIDDIFAFIITMPTSHRVACFRDDVVFLIYLYQRWLYPVDKNRIDDSTTMEDANENDQVTEGDKKDN